VDPAGPDEPLGAELRCRQRDEHPWLEAHAALVSILHVPPGRDVDRHDRSLAGIEGRDDGVERRADSAREAEAEDSIQDQVVRRVYRSSTSTDIDGESQSLGLMCL
jgi:hypothetical protein